MLYGLKEQIVESMCQVFAHHPVVKEAVLYGSRAMGNFKPGSDIDISLFGESLTAGELGVIDEELDDLLLPYQIDLSIFHRIDNMKLREHIERVGVVLYRKPTP